MIVPRSWSAIEKQRSPEQSRLIAQPSATDIRFKVAAFLLFGSWLTTVFSLQHSIKHYKIRNRGLFNLMVGVIRYMPAKFLLMIPLSLVMIGYEAAIAFNFSISPLNINTNLGIMYGLGWGVIAAIVVIQEISGYLNPNEDRELIRQRRVRGAEIDQEMGIQKKPHWWSRLNGPNQELNVHAQIIKNVREIGGGSATARNVERNIEMRIMSKQQDNNKPVEDLETVHRAANLQFPAHIMQEETQERFTDRPDSVRGRSFLNTKDNEQSQVERHNFIDRSESKSSSASGATLGAQPQQIRSMLDI
jgi:hypothetical protein